MTSILWKNSKRINGTYYLINSSLILILWSRFFLVSFDSEQRPIISVRRRRHWQSWRELLFRRQQVIKVLIMSLTPSLLFRKHGRSVPHIIRKGLVNNSTNCLLKLINKEKIHLIIIAGLLHIFFFPSFF